MSKQKALKQLVEKIKADKISDALPFSSFLDDLIKNPDLFFKDIFKVFADMVEFYLYEDKTKKRNLLTLENADFDKIFYDDCEEPFFIDRLLANRLLKLTNVFKKGGQYGQIYLFEGPPGSGKSTFLNNILAKLQAYTHKKEGVLYQTNWKIDSLDFTCPEHDNPIIQIPKQYRRDFLNQVLPESEFKTKLFNEKIYEWVWKTEPCALCKSIQKNITEKENEELAFLNYLYAKPWTFDRQYGDGISVFNPNDMLIDKPLQNEILKKDLETYFKKQFQVIYSVWANTNNGIVALMDIKGTNVERLMSIHGLVSDSVHKVGLIEENIKSFFMGSVNPADKVHYQYTPSFQDRIVTIPVPYILDYNTEVDVYKHKFGKNITQFFQPRVIQNIARIIISTRLQSTDILEQWLEDSNQYLPWLDRDLFILKMEIYADKLPNWLSEEDRKNFDEKFKKELGREAENEGQFGFSGRQSLQIFNAIYTKYSKNEKLITMEMIEHFFEEREKDYQEIPSEFVSNLIDYYDFETLQELKESVYSYNETHIQKDILNYLFALNYESDNLVFNPYTNEKIEISTINFWNFEHIILGTEFTTRYAEKFRNMMRKDYVAQTLVQEVQIQGKTIQESLQYQFLYEKYTQNLKENSLNPYLEDENFKRAIQDYDTHAFQAYNERMKNDIILLLNNLEVKFNYSKEGAKQIVLYALEKDLMTKFVDNE
ncbi:MAG: hypothetical protein EAZ85_06385 [Bacteroidetes bacterium]|nr:MAG: hypothetical protein EAZ85_06385 [Bacteroidota bacterium]TAG86628.1 MAG: hypothetical protein EAZ20_12395 [Bacteroidota bacterium]